MPHIDLDTGRSLRHGLTPRQANAFAHYLMFGNPDSVCPGCGEAGHLLDGCPDCGDPGGAGWWTAHTENCPVMALIHSHHHHDGPPV
jgi:hypothetical protein